MRHIWDASRNYCWQNWISTYHLTVCVCVLRSWCAHILFIFGIWFLFSFFQFYFGSASTCFILMRDGGNGAQESSLGWELSHGAPDPSLVEGFRPSADFRPCHVFSIYTSRSWLNVIFGIFFGSLFLFMDVLFSDWSLFGFMVLWYSLLILTAVAAYIHVEQLYPET